MSVELSVAAAHASHVHPTGASARHEPGHDGGEAPGATRSRGDDGATTTTLSPGVERRAEVARRIAEIQGAAAGELDPRHDAATASGGIAVPGV